MSREGILFILVGPSGAGKNTLMKRVQEQIPDLPQLATATTRPKRPAEQDGREHMFVSRDEFQHLIDTDALIEYTPVHSGNLYGTPRATVEGAIASGHDLIADIEFLGAGQVHAGYPQHTVLIFVTPSSLDLLTDRIRQRGNITAADLAHRLARVRFEMTFAPTCDYVIVNDLLEPAVEHLRQIILSERVRRSGDQVPMLLPPTLHSNVIALVHHDDHILVRPDTNVPTFPRFPLPTAKTAPDTVLQTGVRETLSPSFALDIIEDERFDFVAPHYADIAVIPNDIYLYFYYRCTAPERLDISGWTWRPGHELTLSASLRRLIQPETATLSLSKT